jgi:hypothetical protein
MSDCDDKTVVTAPSRPYISRRMKTMKKIMSLMLGLSLVMGAVTIASAQDAPKKEQSKKKSKKKKKEENK